MGLINIPDIQDDDEATAELWNSRYATIVDEINGNLTSDNLADSAVTTSKLNNSSVTTAKIADDAITSAKLDWATIGSSGIWWEELGRTTISVAGDTISVPTIAARKYLRILIFLMGTGGTMSALMRFNNDSGANYAFALASSGGASSSSVSQTGVLITGATTYHALQFNCDVNNFATANKILSGSRLASTASAASTAPNHAEYAGKWANIVSQITRVDVLNEGTGSFAIGSEVVVLGHD